jgi:hypothetical protein
MKPNCYDCIHRGDVPGSAHSSCRHPVNEKVHNDPLIGLLSIFGSVGRTAPIMADTGLGVKGNPHGISHGWFNWPMNFDPTWLESCNGFTQKPQPEGGEKSDAQTA